MIEMKEKKKVIRFCNVLHKMWKVKYYCKIKLYFRNILHDQIGKKGEKVKLENSHSAECVYSCISI